MQNIIYSVPWLPTEISKRLHYILKNGKPILWHHAFAYLRKAIENDQVECMDFLIQKCGFSQEQKEDALLCMAEHNSLGCLKLFLEKYKQEICFEMTLILQLCEEGAKQGSRDCLALLLEEIGEDRTIWGFALSVAAQNGHHTCVAFLLEKCDISYTDKDFALQYAQRKSECVALLEKALEETPPKKLLPVRPIF